MKPRAVTASFTYTDADYEAFADTSLGSVTGTLPSATGRNGKRFAIVKTDASANGATINGITAVKQGGRIEVESNGTSWVTLTAPMATVNSGTTADGVTVDGTTVLSSAQKTALTGGGSASGQHTHAASDLASGTIAAARLGSGSTGGGTNVLYDNQTWAPPPGAGSGEANTLALETGSTGVSAVGTKTGTALGVLGFKGASTRVTTARDDTNHNVTIDVNTGTTSGTVAAGDDSRLANATDLSHHTVPSQAVGDLLYADSTTSFARVAGNTTAAKQFLTGTGTGTAAQIPAWGTIATGDLPTIPATGGGTGQTTYTTGDVLYASATNTLSKLAKGTSGQFLKQGASTPSWGTPSIASLIAGVQSKSTAYTLTSADDVIELSLTTATPYTLPAASSNIGRLYVLVHTGTAGAVATIARAGSDTFTGGFTSWELRTKGEWVALLGNAAGNGWTVVAASYSTAPVEKGNSTTALSLAWTPTQQVFHTTLTGNCTFTFSQIPVGGAAILQVDTGAGGFTGSFAVSGLGTLKTFGGAPTVTPTAARRDVYMVEYDGTNAWLSVLGQGGA